MTQSLVSRLMHRLGWLDPVADLLQQGANALLNRDGAPTSVKNLLNGRPLGHALHPALTDVPIGAWTAAAVMDGLALGGSQGMQQGADTCLAIGIAGAVASAVTGVADWSDTQGEMRRTGMAHALLNTTALTLNLLSLLRRRRGDRGSGLALSALAFGITVVAGHMGGEMVFAQGAGVNHQIWPEPPPEFTPVMDSAALAENSLIRARAGDVSICLLRRGNEIHAFEEWCTHLGGPLSEGELDGNLVTCPWHASQFDVTTGAVTGSPATIPLRTFTARLREGKVEVQPRA
jgi:nitrite reductase/ring-hydroxylating ferredoxin subunit/uncharacterized membrane protein